MSIDWITVGAQIANFLLLVWLLKRFLYQPILRGIDAREAEIRQRMAAAGVAEDKARTAEAGFLQQKQQLQEDQGAVVERIERETAAKRDQIVAKARAQLAQEQQDWRAYLESERDRFTTELRRAGAETMFELTRKALYDLADQSLEEQIARYVAGRLQPLMASLQTTTEHATEAVITTRGELSAQGRAQVTAALRDTLPEFQLRFEVEPEQAPGLILRVGGVQVAWTVDSYMNSFDDLMNERLTQGAPSRSVAL